MGTSELDYGYTLRMAIRAVVSGLHHAGTIDQRHLKAIVVALDEAAAKAERTVLLPEAAVLMELRGDIARDGQVSV